MRSLPIITKQMTDAMQKAERARDLAAFADKVYEASEPRCERCDKPHQSSLPHCASCHRELWTDRDSVPVSIYTYRNDPVHAPGEPMSADEFEALLRASNAKYAPVETCPRVKREPIHAPGELDYMDDQPHAGGPDTWTDAERNL